ncbi:MAG: hypothetical protein IPI49_07035 [Myxococcales bacterium]|nr:hypothetical protein [Myxococcales bacterium]
MRYTTVGNLLRSRGVALPGAANSAGSLYTSGAGPMGAPSYNARVRENLAATTSGASRLMDIFASASTEIIAGFANIEACKVGGVAPRCSTLVGPAATRRRSPASLAPRWRLRSWTSATRPSLAPRTPPAPTTKPLASAWQLP